MGASHHGEYGGMQREKSELMQRFLEQASGTAKREWAAGRMGGEDDGNLAYALATDVQHRIIVMRFGKPVEWIGLGIEEATQLRDQLTERLLELRGVTP